MHPIIRKTFGGLSASYLARQFIFGLMLSGFVLFTLSHGQRPIPVSTYAFLIVNTLLYPYSRFVYESIIGFLMGSNVFYVNAIFLIATKLFTMAMCWVFSLFIAPFGLLYLYFHHSRAG